MQIASYRTIRGAQRYADHLSRLFPKCQFVVQCHPFDFTYSVRVMRDGKPVAYAAKRKRTVIDRGLAFTTPSLR